MGDCSSYYTNNNTYYNHHRHLHARSRHAAGEQDAALTAGTASPPRRPRRAAPLPGSSRRRQVQHVGMAAAETEAPSTASRHSRRTRSLYRPSAAVPSAVPPVIGELGAPFTSPQRPCDVTTGAFHIRFVNDVGLVLRSAEAGGVVNSKYHAQAQQGM